MNKTSIIVVLIVVLIGGYFLLGGNDSAENIPVDNDTTAEVTDETVAGTEDSVEGVDGVEVEEGLDEDATEEVVADETDDEEVSDEDVVGDTKQ